MTAPLTSPETAPATTGQSGLPPLKLLIAAPRGFCAGVDRAITIVELALEKYGAPVYVRHEIVHNKYVVDALKQKGAIFVETLGEVPDDVPVVFSAHGVPKAVPACPRSTGRPNAMSKRAAISSLSAMRAIPKSSAQWDRFPKAR